MQQEFLKPKLDGDRFDGHTIPLELLKDFAVLEEMLVEVAKWKFRKQFPQRERGLRNFTKGIELHLAQIEEGSAIPAIVLTFSALVPPPNAMYLDQARTAIIEAISSAEHNHAPDLPPNLLSYFDRFGRGLRENESMTFTNNKGEPVHLTTEVRHRLIRAAQVQEWTEEISVRGKIPEMDQIRGTFELLLLDGKKLEAPLSDQHRGTLFQAFDGYKNGTAVMLQGVAKRDRNRFRSIELIQHVSILDPLDVSLRIAELGKLEDGWLDGNGKAPALGQLNTLGQLFDLYFAADIQLPHIYPTAEGGIQAEWSVGQWEATLEIDIDSWNAEYQAFNISTGQTHEAYLRLDLPNNWQELEKQLREIGAGLL